MVALVTQEGQCGFCRLVGDLCSTFRCLAFPLSYNPSHAINPPVALPQVDHDMNAVSSLRPQTPGGARPCAFAPSHKRGRPVGLAVRLSRTGLRQTICSGGAACMPPPISPRSSTPSRPTPRTLHKPASPATSRSPSTPRSPAAGRRGGRCGRRGSVIRLRTVCGAPIQRSGSCGMRACAPPLPSLIAGGAVVLGFGVTLV